MDEKIYDINMEIIDENKILTREGVVEFIDNQYVKFNIHNHIHKHTIENLYENIEAFKTLCNGNKYPLLVVTKSMDRLSKEEEDIIRATSPGLFTQHAIVTTNKFSIAIINIILSLRNPVIPMRVFSNKEDAIDWFELK